MAKPSLQDRKAKLEAELEKIKDQEKRAEKIRHELIGLVVEKAMKGNVELGQTINELLDTTLTKKADREQFGLTPLSSNRGRPALARTE